MITSIRMTKLLSKTRLKGSDQRRFDYRQRLRFYYLYIELENDGLEISSQFVSTKWKCKEFIEPGSNNSP
ncbi:hypothetical protein INT82_14775 [Mannheimia haemolytica]|nr:hypothetical protein [Mannheimia haemolytica]